MFDHLKNDIAVALEKDPAAKSKLEVLLTYSGTVPFKYFVSPIIKPPLPKLYQNKLYVSCHYDTGFVGIKRM